MTAITMTVTLNDEDNFKMGRGIQQWRLPDKVTLLVCCFQVKLRLVKWVLWEKEKFRGPAGTDGITKVLESICLERRRENRDKESEGNSNACR